MYEDDFEDEPQVRPSIELDPLEEEVDPEDEEFEEPEPEIYEDDSDFPSEDSTGYDA
jgi:hypothetical protein